MTKVICVSNLKGGVGKTTTTHNMGSALARMGHTVLMIDWDPQGNLTRATGLDPQDPELKTIYDAIDPEIDGTYYDRKKLNPYTVNYYDNRLFILTANLKLAGFDAAFNNIVIDREEVLNYIVENFKGKVDYIIIDCNPALNLLTLNAMMATDIIMIPIQADKYAEDGLDKTIGFIQKINRKYKKDIKAFAFFNLFDPRNVLSKEYWKHLKDDKEETNLLDTYIRRNVALVESKEMGMDIFLYDERMTKNAKKEVLSNGNEDYYNLTNELLYNIGVNDQFETSREIENEERKAEQKEPGTLSMNEIKKKPLKEAFKEFMK